MRTATGRDAGVSSRASIRAPSGRILDHPDRGRRAGNLLGLAARLAGQRRAERHVHGRSSLTGGELGQGPAVNRFVPVGGAAANGLGQNVPVCGDVVGGIVSRGVRGRSRGAGCASGVGKPRGRGWAGPRRCSSQTPASAVPTIANIPAMPLADEPGTVTAQQAATSTAGGIQALRLRQLCAPARGGPASGGLRLPMRPAAGRKPQRRAAPRARRGAGQTAADHQRDRRGDGRQ